MIVLSCEHSCWRELNLLKTNAIVILRATLGAARGICKCLIISGIVSSNRVKS